jgi:hypothetical protein
LSNRDNNSDKPLKNRPVSPRSGTPVPTNPNGRPKGIPNKSTQAVREAIAIFIEKNAAKLDQWASEIYDAKGAEGAMKVFTDLLEYAQPKLARQEVQQLDKDGAPTDLAEQVSKMSAEDAYKALLKGK